MDSSARSGPTATNGSTGGSLNKAERFEDEKRRIISSCFGKTDEDGTLLESYITHIRIIEDGAYPSSPPPPTSSAEMKKPRLIIVAVRKSGRVRMHKARENANGTFSIGKTWVLDDLSAVEVFNSVNSRNPEDIQRAKWAGGKGFIVTIGKPYYWEATTPKEKQFFIASLVKIYTKYTGGKAPILLGFESREKDALLVGSVSSPQSKRSRSSLEMSPTSSTAPRERNRSRGPSQDPLSSRKASKDSVDQAPPDSGSSRPSTRSRRDESPAVVEPPGNLSAQQSAPSLRKLASNNSQDTFMANNRSEDSLARPQRPTGATNGTANISGRFQARNITPTSQQAITPDSMKDVNTSATPAPLSFPPERRRPPISDTYGGTSPNENNIPTPLASPTMRKDDIRLPARSRSRPTSTNLELSPSKKEEAPAPEVVSPTEAESPVATLQPLPAFAEPPPAQPLPPPPPPPQEELPKPKDEDRPGLGPMIKKKADLASKLRMAASAAHAFKPSTTAAFKPRAGGAAERLRMQREKELAGAVNEGPDGINGVVPAPSLLRNNSSGTGPGVADAISPKAPDTADSPKISTPAAVEAEQDIPEVKVTEPAVPEKTKKAEADKEADSTATSTSPGAPKSREPVRSRERTEQTQKYLDSLGIDASVLQGRGEDFIDMLDHYGWVGEGVHTLRADDVLERMHRDLDKAQVGPWIDLIETSEAKRQEVIDGIDEIIGACDELDNLLTLYNVELGTLAPDIAYIEAQAEGLQVQAANQKLLKAELDSLLDTISISSDELKSLREASLETPRGLEQIEESLVTLYQAMVKINPSLGMSSQKVNDDGSVRSGKTGGISDSEIGNMRVVKEKKVEYKMESNLFLQRLKPFLQVKFSMALDTTRQALEKEREGQATRRPGRAKLDPRYHDLARGVLWKYSPIMLFSREMNRVEWEHIMQSYAGSAKPLYQEEFRDFVFAWKRIAKKATGDEAELLFTSQIEKQADGIATTARKLTVKRSHTLAKTLRSPMGETGSRLHADKTQDGRLNWYEVVTGILEEQVPIIVMEQNFIIEFFHASSLDQSDFPDIVVAAPPNERYGGNLRQNKVMDPNRDLARTVGDSMGEIYSFWGGDLQNLVDWALKEDPLQGVGVLAILERILHELETTNQEFLVRSLRSIHTRLIGLFNKFVDEQIRAIEDTKVKINKRKGIIGFSRIFPHFSHTIETMLASAEDLDIRETVNNAYSRIIKTMFESLKVIARENPAAAPSGAGDPEDKEALNYEILIIQNMNHFIEEVDPHQNPVLEEWQAKAAEEVSEHIDLYVTAVIRRPLKVLLATLESAESIVALLPAGSPPSSITAMPSHSRATFSKAIVDFDLKSVRKKADELKKRVEKHFGGDSDEPGSQQVITKILQRCEQRYAEIVDRFKTISRDVYGGEVQLDWTYADIATALRR